MCVCATYITYLFYPYVITQINIKICITNNYVNNHINNYPRYRCNITINSNSLYLLIMYIYTYILLHKCCG